MSTSDQDETKPEWFVVYCEDDDSHSVVPNDDVLLLGLGETPKAGEEVQFFMNGKTWKGIIKDCGFDFTQMIKIRDKLNTQSKPRREPSFHADKPRSAKVKCNEVLFSGKPVCTTVKKVPTSSVKAGIKNATETESEKAANENDDDHSASEENSGKKPAPLDLDESDCESLTEEEKKLLQKIAKKNRKGDFQELATLASLAGSQNLNRSQGGSKSRRSIISSSDSEPDTFKNESSKGQSSKSQSSKSQSSKSQSSKSQSSKNESSKNESSKKDSSKKDSSKKDLSKKDLSKKDSSKKDSTKDDSSTSVNKRKSPNDSSGPGSSRTAADATSSDSSAGSDTENSQRRSSSSPYKARTSRPRSRRVYPKLEFQGEFFKHKENDPDAVQLHEDHNDVFILNRIVKELKRDNSIGSSSALARAVVKHIFTPEALLECSVFGRPSAGKGREAMTCRPALHPSGVQAITKFVLARGEKKNWKNNTKGVVHAALANVICEGRALQMLMKKAQD